MSKIVPKAGHEEGGHADRNAKRCAVHENLCASRGYPKRLPRGCQCSID